MLKKKILALTLGLAAFSTQANVSFNELNKEDLKEFKEDFIFNMTDGDPNRDTDVINVKQLNDSDNYLIKVKEDGYVYTMLYIKELNSAVIKNSGEMFNFDSEYYVTKDYEASFVKPMLDKIDREDLVTFKSEKENAKELFVFTDPSCGYCRKLHSEINDYLEEGITINYLPFPRGGEGNEAAFQALTNAFCSEDRKAGFDYIKTRNVPLKRPEGLTDEEYSSCEDKVRFYYEYGSSMGVTGTPAVFDKNGFQLGGYIPAKNLKHMISN